MDFFINCNVIIKKKIKLNSENPLLTLTDVYVVIFHQNWCHFLEDDAKSRSAFVKRILQKMN